MEVHLKSQNNENSVLQGGDLNAIESLQFVDVFSGI